MCRFGITELLGVQFRDTTFNVLCLLNSRHNEFVGYQLEFTTPKTRRARRVVALDERTLAVLKAHRKAQTEEKLRFQTPDQGHNLVFRKWDGEPIHPDAFSKAFNKRVAATEVPRIRFHDLRHTHATLLLQAGTNPKVVSERLGHSTVSITLDTYSHVIPSLQEDAAKRASELVFAEVG
jgi:integrase